MQKNRLTQPLCIIQVAAELNRQKTEGGAQEVKRRVA